MILAIWSDLGFRNIDGFLIHDAGVGVMNLDAENSGGCVYLSFSLVMSICSLAEGC